MQKTNAVKRDFRTCPRCKAPTVPCESFSGAPSEFWRECIECNTYINTYVPQPHQIAVHMDPHTYIGNFGAYGTGKTLTSRQEVYKHALITPNANILIGAEIVPQYEQTIKRDIEMDIPAAFVKHYSAQKSYMDLFNGARILFRPFYNPDNLRSLNLSMFVIIEASEVDGDAFHQLKTRLRNMAAANPLRDEHGEIVYNNDGIPEIESDWRRGLVESNPDSGWVRTDVLMVSDKIYKHGGVLDNYSQEEFKIDRSISSHVASTDVNKYLPKDFIREVTANKPSWWVGRYILSSFSYAEGLVYPKASDCFVKPFTIPQHWQRLAAHDYGLQDPAVFLWGAIDQRNGLLYIYKEFYEQNNNIDELAAAFLQGSGDINVGGWYTTPIIDPKSGPKRDYNKKSLIDLYADYGISFKPGHVSVDARVLRLNTYIETGRLRIFDTCTNLARELKDYKFAPRSLTTDKTPDKPVDKNNHAINALEWIAMELPSDPSKLTYGAFDPSGREITQYTAEHKILPHALTDKPRVSNDMPYEISGFDYW